MRSCQGILLGKVKQIFPEATGEALRLRTEHDFLGISTQRPLRKHLVLTIESMFK